MFKSYLKYLSTYFLLIFILFHQPFFCIQKFSLFISIFYLNQLFHDLYFQILKHLPLHNSNSLLESNLHLGQIDNSIFLVLFNETQFLIIFIHREK